MRYLLPIAAAVLVPTAPSLAAQPRVEATASLQELLAADRAWSVASKDRNLIDALVAMFDRDGVLISGGSPTLIKGPDAIRARLAARPENATSTAEWSPIGGGISADGSQGFTYGSFTVRPRNGAPVAQKYLAYWVKRPEGWRVFAMKRAGRTGTDALKSAPNVIGTGARRPDDAAATLKASEKAFSDEAQVVGLRVAFKKWGRADSMNLGGEDTIAIGAEAIGNGVAGPEPGSPLTWAADEVLVAPSGDMGLSYGLLHAKSPPESQPATIPFITIWARPKPGDPWRYVAE